jgi:predicted acyl esterase
MQAPPPKCFWSTGNRPSRRGPEFSLFDVYTDIAFPGGVQLAWFTGNWARLNRALDSNRLPDDVPWYARLAIKGVRPVDEGYQWCPPRRRRP